jgi:hypothetical protein
MHESVLQDLAPEESMGNRPTNAQECTLQGSLRLHAQVKKIVDVGTELQQQGSLSLCNWSQVLRSVCTCRQTSVGLAASRIGLKYHAFHYLFQRGSFQLERPETQRQHSASLGRT